MIFVSEAEQKSRKTKQLARIAAKGSPDYPVLYAQQPEVIRHGLEQKAKRDAEREARAILEARAVAEGEAAESLWSRAGSANLTGG